MIDQKQKEDASYHAQEYDRIPSFYYSDSYRGFGESHSTNYETREPDKDLLAFFESQPTFYQVQSSTSFFESKKTIGCEFNGNVYTFDIHAHRLLRAVYVDCRVQFTKKREPRILGLNEELRGGVRNYEFSSEVYFDFEGHSEVNYRKRFNELWNELLVHIEQFKLDKALGITLTDAPKRRPTKI